MEGVQTKLAEMAVIIREIRKEIAEGIINLDKAAEERQADLIKYYRNQIQCNLQRKRDMQKHLEMALDTEREKARKELRERKELEREKVRKESEEAWERKELERERARASDNFSLLQYFFLQPSPASSMKKDSAKASSRYGKIVTTIEEAQKQVSEIISVFNTAAGEGQVEPRPARHQPDGEAFFKGRETSGIGGNTSKRCVMRSRRGCGKSWSLRGSAKSWRKRGHAKSRSKRGCAKSRSRQLQMYFFPQSAPTSSRKKGPVTVTSQSAGTEGCRAESDADGQQEQDLSLPAGSGLRKRFLNSAEVRSTFWL
ncbi:hypothetical protein BJ741DRAFT_584542 [Chytriomyces cf. hyalinus JEL632]|nr:hypothetical protein BJ741DRAFT_584542 [Chytriomyces cf. hyalinus JEL632]